MSFNKKTCVLTRRNLLGLGALSLCVLAAAPPPDKKPPFELGGILDDDGKKTNLPPPDIAILKPMKDEKLRFGRPLKVHVGLTIPAGGQLPTFVLVSVKRKGVIHGNRSAYPLAKGPDGHYTLEAELKNLKGPAGDYEIEVEAVYEYAKGGEPTRFHKSVTRYFDSGHEEQV